MSQNSDAHTNMHVVLDLNPKYEVVPVVQDPGCLHNDTDRKTEGKKERKEDTKQNNNLDRQTKRKKTDRMAHWDI